MTPSASVVDLRRDFHRHPEVGFCEFRTASRAAGILADLGWDVLVGADAMAPDSRLGVPEPTVLDAAYRRAARDGADDRFLPAMRGGLTGVLATLRGNRPGPVTALRADLDALPLAESADEAHLPAREGFRSLWPGAMHACGHDGHVAVALTIAGRLADRDFPGTVRLVLQPAEEGGRGAAAMVEAGAVDDVDVFLAAHLGLGLPTGSVCPAIPGLLANSKLRATFHGTAAHAAMAPERGRHALLGAAAAAVAVHTMPPYSGHETRVNVGMLTSGTSSNIVPDTAVMLLETRADEGAVNEELERRVRATLTGAAGMYGLDLDVELVGSVTTAPNDPDVARAVEAAARAAGATVTGPGAGIASDDATAFMRRVRAHGGVAGYLGIGADSPAPHHATRFDIDEAALPVAVNVLDRVLRGGLDLS
ncbi:amidohydrolase [Amycolatopsis alkalitolerans]|uniref:Amidohydrolase n=1 Tax=Amycolatopsis alkalitolerans TaxID=2547244 RepID=A0A5C4M4C7_9PSEU|nr:amidohydrolase [Amycolatopsis alkalitolerans]TNC26444.1 amidohydrolase [Amycolatopsis alkalitolerans]